MCKCMRDRLIFAQKLVIILVIAFLTGRISCYSVSKRLELQGGSMQMNLDQYTDKIIHVADHWGNHFTGIASSFPPGYGLVEFDREENSVNVNRCQIFESDIAQIEELPKMEIIRASQLFQQAGAYYVRIQAMAKKHHITLRQEFDEHDGPDTKYIVVTDDDFPIATARMYPLDDTRMMIGRVVVLPEYRHRGIGTMVVCECEDWAEDLHYSRTVLESRDNKVEFYELLGYEVCGEAVEGDTFRCIRMEKKL